MFSLHRRYLQQSLAMYGGGGIFSMLLFTELWCASMLQRADAMSAWIGYTYPILMVGIVVGNVLGRGEAIRVSCVAASQSDLAHAKAYQARSHFVGLYALCIGVCVFFTALLFGLALPRGLMSHTNGGQWSHSFLLCYGVLIWMRSCFFLFLWVYMALGKIRVFTRFTLFYAPLQVLGMGLVSQITWSKDSWMGMFGLVGAQIVGFLWLYVVIHRYAERRLGCVLVSRPRFHRYDFYKVLAGGASSAAEVSYLALLWMILHAVGISIRSDYLLIVPIMHRVEHLCVAFINPMMQSILTSLTKAFVSNHWLRYRCILSYMTRYALGLSVFIYMGFWFFEKQFIGIFSSSTRVMDGLEPVWMWMLTAVFQSVFFIYLNIRHTSVGRYVLTWKVNGLRLFLLLLGLWMLLGVEKVDLVHIWIILCVSQCPALAVSYLCAVGNVRSRL